MPAEQVHVDRRYAQALGLQDLAPETVAVRLAELGGLPRPSRDETISLLVRVLTLALSEIPSSGAAWSWGEFHNGGIQPLFDMSRQEDWQLLALCAVDLGLDGELPRMRPGEVLTPRGALARNLMQAIEELLRAIRARLEAAGVSPHGQPTPQP